MYHPLAGHSVTTTVVPRITTVLLPYSLLLPLHSILLHHVVYHYYRIVYYHYRIVYYRRFSSYRTTTVELPVITKGLLVKCRKEYKSVYRYMNIRPEKVMNALRWLMRNSPLYQEYV